jgi:hypothetical protein
MSKFDRTFEEKFEKSIERQGEVTENAGLKAAGIGLAAGTGAAAATGLGVAALGTASTGTAIATLGGAAATNATLAAIGGGSLAAGGLGMAAGAAILATGGLAVAAVGGIGAYMYMMRRRSEAAPPVESAQIETQDEGTAYLDTLRIVAAIESPNHPDKEAVLTAIAQRLGIAPQADPSHAPTEPWRLIRTPALQRQLIRDMLFVLHADGVRHPEESELVERVAASFALPRSLVEKIEAFVEKSISCMKEESDLFA